MSEYQTLVSVIIPVYNAEFFIERCLKSVLAQSYHNLEVIVIDDGSTDSSVSLVEAFTADPRLKLISQRNMGPAAARNRGIIAACGKFLCFVDADDFVDINYVKLLCEPMITQRDISLTVCNYIEYSRYYPSGYAVKQVSRNEKCFADEFLPRLLHGTMGVLWGKMFRMEIIKINNFLLPEDIYFQEDLVFVSQYVAASDFICNIPENLYHYNRMNANSITNVLEPKHLEQFNKVQRELFKITDNKVVKSLISMREIIFNQQYLLSMGNILSKKEYERNIKKIDSLIFAKKFSGDIQYKLYFYLLDKNLISAAFYYLKILKVFKELIKVFKNKKKNFKSTIKFIYD